MQQNVESIRKTLRDEDYHIYVVDNASTDGVAEWLVSQSREHKDISVVCNSENQGFPRGCNQGVELAESEGDYDSDIFLLNNDTRLCENSVRNLKQALYYSDYIGATSGISNYAGNNQQIDIKFSLPSGYVDWGNSNNIVANEANIKDLWEERVRLNGFAMLIKREVWNKVGGMDEMYSPGYIEDDDISLKILELGKRLMVCKNSFIYHAGSQSFSKLDYINILFKEHYDYFIKKHGVSLVDYVYSKEYYKSQIPYTDDDQFEAIVLGCSIGADVKWLRSKYRKARIIGIEYDDNLREIAGYTECVYKTVSELSSKVSAINVNLIIANKSGLDRISEEDYLAIDNVCDLECKIIYETEICDESCEKADSEYEINDMEDCIVYDHAVDSPKYNAIIMTVPNDYSRLEHMYTRLINTLPAERVSFVGSGGVKACIDKGNMSQLLDYVDEDSILPFDKVHSVMTDALSEILLGRELPRGVTGWYYQQFLKMSYSYLCENEYYLVWDGDTIPCGPFSMFSKENGKPYLDLKTEYHDEYFVTLSKILPGMGKVIAKSFISEHMLIKTDYMRELIEAIESNDNLNGTTYYEKIIYAIPPEKLLSNSFSEFETYGTFVALRHTNDYMLRNWYSFRYGGDFFDINKISESDFKWLSKDFFAISFEKGHEVREDHKNLFDNKEYQEKLSARQMLEIAQEEFSDDSFKESWD